MKQFAFFLLAVPLLTMVPFSAGEQNALAQQATYTTLSGFYDYQSNGGACKQIVVNPANGNIHVVTMSSFDSTNVAASRRTVYAFSTNGGTTWNNFGNLEVPASRSGFPSIDLVGTANGYCLVIANNSDEGTGNCGHVYVDCPEGGGAFSEISMGSTNVCLQWPQIACTSDSTIVFVGTGDVNGVDGTYVKRLDTTRTWTRLTSQNAGGRYVVCANGMNHVSVLINLLYNGVHLFESTDNGRTWPSTPVTIYPPQRIAGADTFQAFVGCDLTYLVNSPVAALQEFMTNAGAPTDSAGILFWSQETGLVVAANKPGTPGVVRKLNKPQINHMTMGYPAIVVVQQRIAIFYQAFMPETSMAGFNYSDIFHVLSDDRGAYWYAASNDTRTPNLDERYPCTSKTHWPQSPHFANVVWQEDPQPGSAVVGDNAPFSRASQKFFHVEIVPIGGVEQKQPVPDHFALDQNYPNPFNPATTIRYTLPPGTHGRVSLRVYDVLGREVATLVDEEKQPGRYHVTWGALHAASGVYFYQLKAGDFLGTKRMVVIK